MAVLTREEYVQSLRKQKPRVYLGGERVDNIVDHPLFKVGINSCAVTYEAAHDPRYRDLSTVMSPLINERISLWTHILDNEQQAMAKVKLMRGLGDYLGPCCYRCLTSDILNAAWAVSYDIDKKYGTSYHQRVVKIVKEAQRNDWILGGTVVDPKGDRSLRPSKQPDPDMYLHVVERRNDGIVVRGAKAHSTAAPYTNMLYAIPSGPLREDERDYAVAFFTPIDTEGVTFIARGASVPPEPKELENPISSKFGHVESLVLYDNVFVPWERVFLCGEYEFAGLLMGALASSHMLHKCGCRSGSMDLYIGATALIADYNGLERAPHIRDYLTEMIMGAEIVYSCGLAAAVDGIKHDSGVYLPKVLPASIGKVYAARKLGEDRYFMQDTAGGAVRTMPTEKDYRNPDTGKYMEKYYKGRAEVPTEHRIRAFKLIEDLTASDYAGWYHAMCISGGTGPQALKTVAFLNYDLEGRKRRARIAAGIGE